MQKRTFKARHEIVQLLVPAMLQRRAHLSLPTPPGRVFDLCLPHTQTLLGPRESKH